VIGGGMGIRTPDL